MSQQNDSNGAVMPEGMSMDLEANTWYWISSPVDGDIFSPALAQEDGLILIDDDVYTVTQLSGLTFTKAVMPTTLSPTRKLK